MKQKYLLCLKLFVNNTDVFGIWGFTDWNSFIWKDNQLLSQNSLSLDIYLEKPIPFGQDMSFHLWAHSADINAAAISEEEFAALISYISRIL